jgi:hypothetical protein
MQTWFTENEGLDPGMAAAIFRLSRRSVFIQTLPSREQGEYKVTNSSWKLASMDRGTGSRNKELPKIGDEGRVTWLLQVHISKAIPKKLLDSPGEAVIIRDPKATAFKYT